MLLALRVDTRMLLALRVDARMLLALRVDASVPCTGVLIALRVDTRMLLALRVDARMLLALRVDASVSRAGAQAPGDEPCLARLALGHASLAGARRADLRAQYRWSCAQRAQPDVEVELVDRLWAGLGDIPDRCVAADGDLGRFLAGDRRLVRRHTLRAQDR